MSHSGSKSCMSFWWPVKTERRFKNIAYPSSEQTMANRKPQAISRKPKLSPARKRRLKQQQQNSLHFEQLEVRRLLAAVTVGNSLDLVNADTSSIAALIADDGGDGISLREAITAANNTAGADTVTFDASVFTGGAASSVSGNGTDDGKFEIVSGNQLQFKSAPDFENPTDLGGTVGDNVYEVSVLADDGNGGTTP